MDHDLSLEINREWFILSNAFSKSIYITSSCALSLKASINYCSKIHKLFIKESPFRNPCCSFQIIRSNRGDMIFVTNLENNFERFLIYVNNY